MKAKVDILDLISVTVVRLPPASPQDLAPISVELIPHEEGKQVVVDETALATLNANLSEKAKQLELDPRNPQTFSYLQEFVGRMVSELYRNGLVELEDVPEGADDPYHKVRKWTRPN